MMWHKWWRRGKEAAASGHLHMNKQLSWEEIHLPWEETTLDGNWLGQVYFSTRLHHAAFFPSPWAIWGFPG